jgi:hypothetical protein
MARNSLTEGRFQNRRRTTRARTPSRLKTGKGFERVNLRPIEVAILKTLPEAPATMAFDELVDGVAQQVNPLVFPLRKTVSRYTKVVQLDLERRGLIERVPGASPLLLRRPGHP